MKKKLSKSEEGFIAFHRDKARQEREWQTYMEHKKQEGKQTHWADEESPTNKKRHAENMNDDEVEAAQGFHGIVYKPTHFLAGEDGTETIDITPIKKQKNIMDYDFLKGFNMTKRSKKHSKGIWDWGY